MTQATPPLDDRRKCDVQRAGADVFAGAGHLLSERCSIPVIEMHDPLGYRELGRKCSEIGHRSCDVDDTSVLAIPQ